MKRKQLRFIVYLLIVMLIVSCTLSASACSIKAKTTKINSTISSISITPISIGLAIPSALKVGSNERFDATAIYSDGSTSDITTHVTWASDNTGVATIDSTGLANAVAAGTANITATLSGVTSSALRLIVISLSSLEVTPASPAALSVGSTLQFIAIGTYSDGSTAGITSQVAWVSDIPSIVTIDSLGLATGVVAGTTSIAASLNGVNSPKISLTVVAP